MSVAVRAYVCKPEAHSGMEEAAAKKPPRKKVNTPSEWVVAFDTETTTDAAQKLRFGSYQVRKGDELIQSGVFYDPATLRTGEQKALREYVTKNQLNMLTVKEFVEDVFYGVGYALRATIVGFNLPFDISRLAIDHSTARASPWNKVMRGGFSFKLSENEENPRVQIKHVSSRDSFIQFAATKGQRTTRGNRKKGRKQLVRRGYFIDAKTLAAALTSQSYSLASLAQALGVQAQKHDTHEHGSTLTPEYIAYAVQDTQTTWESFCALHRLYAAHGLKLTAAHSIHSEASLGKAYLRDMGIKPWHQVQPDFPPDMIGRIMSGYYGGRSEIHIRKEITQILYCDFLSMYPTVCTLMALWRFVTAQGMTWRDTTAETREFLEKVTILDLQQQGTWRSLSTIVQVMPDGEIFPVRAKYGGDAQYTIGANHLTSQTPLWFTLADCISAKLLTGRTPQILQAITFTPERMQENLNPVDITGNPAYRVDPSQSDFFKRVIDLRSEVKKKIKTAPQAEKATLESQQLALKILANATSYGIFVELNVEEEKQLQPLLCYGPSGKAMPIEKKKFEATGSFFHPLLATLITGAARLMLAITERLANEAGIDWAFCDTDSMALAKPEDMSQDEFYKKARQVQEWFTPLNPYAQKAPLLKIEEYNYSLSDKGALEPLYCYTISSKRYALFNIDAGGKIILRKVSAHGLGHLLAPYKRDDNSGLDAEPWQQDLWREIINAARENRQPYYASLKNFNMPAVSRYGASTPALAAWFNKYNEDKPYSDRVRAFNFLMAMQAKPGLKALKPVATFTNDHNKASSRVFDRMTGQNISRRQLKTYQETLAQYHLHPETKFLNGDFTDSGKTQRRHIALKSVQHIGKEANKWEEQFYLGLDPEAQIEYGICPEQKNEILKAVLKSISIHGAKSIAEAARMSERYVLEVGKGKTSPSEKALTRLQSAVKALENANASEHGLRQRISAMMEERKISIRSLAANLEIDPSNLAKILSGLRKSGNQLIRAYEYLMGGTTIGYHEADER